MAVTYEFYTDSFGGSAIPEPAFVKVSQKAEVKLRKFTFGRLPDVLTDAQSLAVCDMAEWIYRSDSRGGKASENIDGYSVSYAQTAEEDEEAKLYTIASDYLDPALLYLGVDGC